MNKPFTGPNRRKSFRDKYLALLIAVLALFTGAHAQDSTRYSNINGYGFRYKRHIQDSVSAMPLSTSLHNPYRAGGYRFDSTNRKLQLWYAGAWHDYGKAVQLTDSSFKIGVDTIVISGTGGGGGGSGTVTNVATGYGLSGGPITVTGTLLVDSATLSTYYLRRKDSVLYVTQTKLNDTAAAIRAAIGGGGGATDISVTQNLTNTITHSSTGLDGTTTYATTSVAGVLSPRSYDLGHLPEIKNYMYAKGLQASASAANYPYTLVDSARSKFISSGSDRGGWLTNNLTGDSIQVRAPFWVVFGDSQAEGHGPGTTGRHGRLDPNGTSGFDPAYPDSTGQLSYHLRFLTNMRWYNHGIGGQNTTQALRRFYRDVVGRPGTFSADNKGNQTLWYKPQGVVIIIGINDIAQGVSLDIIKRNLELMASVCQAEGIRCVMLNMPGDEVFDTTTSRKVETINLWLAEGALDQYNATIVDYNAWWKDPAFNDNYHGNSMIADDIHPSRVGYDSLSNYIFRSAHLPVLKRAIFINEIDGSFSGYSRPTGITIGGGPNAGTAAYTIANAIDSVNITAPVWDSAWIKTTATTNVSGTTFSGFGSILWYCENNTDTLRVTKRTLYSNGSQKPYSTVSKLTVIPPSYASTDPVIDIPLADITSFPYGLQAYADAGQVRMQINGLTTSAAIDNGILSVYGKIATNSNITAQGTNSIIAHQQICTGCSASTQGFGLSTEGTGYQYNWQSTPAALKDMFRLSAYTSSITGVNNWGAGQNNILRITTGFNNYSSGVVNAFGNIISVDPVINNASTNGTNPQIRFLRYAPIVTALNGVRHFGLFLSTGTNMMNMNGDSTAIGFDSTETLVRKFNVKGTSWFSDELNIGNSTDQGDFKLQNTGGLYQNGVTRLDGMLAGTSTSPVLVKDADSVVRQVTLPDLLTGLNIANGPYTPTLTNGTNVSSSALVKAHYTRIGSTVTVYILLTIDPTATGATDLGIQLPVASNLIVPGDLIGLGNCGAVPAQTGVVDADATNERATFSFTATDTGSQSFYISFSYQIIAS